MLKNIPKKGFTQAVNVLEWNWSEFMKSFFEILKHWETKFLIGLVVFNIFMTVVNNRATDKRRLEHKITTSEVQSRPKTDRNMFGDSTNLSGRNGAQIQLDFSDLGVLDRNEAIYLKCARVRAAAAAGFKGDFGSGKVRYCSSTEVLFKQLQ